MLETIRFNIASKELSSTHPPMEERISTLVAMGTNVENFVPKLDRKRVDSSRQQHGNNPQQQHGNHYQNRSLEDLQRGTGGKNR